MNAKRLLPVLLILSTIPLLSCSGPKNRTSGGGNATVSVTLYDTAPAGVSLLSFTLPITAVTFKPSSGSGVTLTPAVTSVEATRLQTDSVLLVDAATIAAGSYSVSVTFGATAVGTNVFINASGAGITYTYNGSSFTCANDAVCYLPASSQATITFSGTLTLSSGENVWIGMDLNLNNAITTANGLTVDFTQANVLTATTTPRVGLPSGAADTIEDFTGIVTALSGSSITVQNGVTAQKLTAALNSSTEYDATLSTSGNAYSACGTNTPQMCLKVGSTVSLNAVLGVSGTLTATEVDVLDSVAVPEVEGIIYPSSNGASCLSGACYGLILADKVAAGNTILGAGSATYGTPIYVNTAAVSTFAIDTNTLTPSATALSGFSKTTDLLAGQQVRVQLGTVNSTSNGIIATASGMLLRFSRLTGSATNPGATSFNFTPPPFVTALNTQLGATTTAGIYNATLFDGVASSSGVPTGTVSIRALFLNTNVPDFAVAKVRVP